MTNKVLLIEFYFDGRKFREELRPYAGRIEIATAAELKFGAVQQADIIAVQIYEKSKDE